MSGRRELLPALAPCCWLLVLVLMLVACIRAEALVRVSCMGVFSVLHCVCCRVNKCVVKRQTPRCIRERVLPLMAGATVSFETVILATGFDSSVHGWLEPSVLNEGVRSGVVHTVGFDNGR